MSEFKYLVNHSENIHQFQFDSEIYEVPPRSKKLMLSDAADHGAKRSIYLTDPQYDDEGNLTHSGNDVMQRCTVEDANVLSPAQSLPPILLEKSKDVVSDIISLSVDKTKPLRKGKGRVDHESPTHAD